VVNPFVKLSQLDIVKLEAPFQAVSPKKEIPEEAPKKMLPQVESARFVKPDAMLTAELSWAELVAAIQLPRELTEDIICSRRCQGVTSRDKVKSRTPLKLELRENTEEARRS
jgi:hypothetical protein